MKNSVNEIDRDEIQKILEENPKWMAHMNVIVIIAVIAIILFISFYIKYPVIISAMITITSVNNDGSLSGKMVMPDNKSETVTSGKQVKLNLQPDSWERPDFLECTITNFSKDYTRGNEYLITLKATDNIKENNNASRLKALGTTKVRIDIITNETPLIKKLLENIKIIPSKI